VPLDTVARFSRKTQALTVNHQGQLPSVTISFNLLPAFRSARRWTDQGAGTRTACPGFAQHQPARDRAGLPGVAAGFGILLLVAILVVYLVLGILYESFIHPLTILSGLPSAGLGALLTLLIFGVDLSLYAFVGIIMLIGIVKKNAIMMIDFALAHSARRGRRPPARRSSKPA
jgi:HAE1 family hydrophobic/amphiphilic exporter-1